MFRKKIIAYTSDRYPKYKVVPYNRKGSTIREEDLLKLYGDVFDNPKWVISSMTPISKDVGFLNFNGQDMVIFYGNDGYGGIHVGFAFVDSLENVKEDLQNFPINSDSIVFSLGLLPDLFINEINE